MLIIFAPFLTASSINEFMYAGLFGSGRGVRSVFSQGRPSFNLSTAKENFSRNSSLIFSLTYIILIAVHLWPLKDNEPFIHSRTVKFISASSRIIAGFFASKPKTSLNLFCWGWSSWSEFAEELCPINANTLIFPDFIIGVAISLPLPNTILTTPGGKDSLNASSSGAISKTPCLAGLKIAVFPIIIAGINNAKVSFNG